MELLTSASSSELVDSSSTDGSSSGRSILTTARRWSCSPAGAILLVAWRMGSGHHETGSLMPHAGTTASKCCRLPTAANSAVTAAEHATLCRQGTRFWHDLRAAAAFSKHAWCRQCWRPLLQAVSTCQPARTAAAGAILWRVCREQNRSAAAASKHARCWQCWQQLQTVSTCQQVMAAEQTPIVEHLPAAHQGSSSCSQAWHANCQPAASTWPITDLCVLPHALP